MIQLLWILKYILYTTYTKRNLISSYWEGGGFCMLFLMPFASIWLIDVSRSLTHLFIAGFVRFIWYVYLAVDEKRTIDKYKEIEKNRKLLSSKFTLVRWIILIDILILILSALYRTGIRENWFS